MFQKHIPSTVLLSLLCNVAIADVTPQAIADFQQFIMTPVDSLEQLAKIYPKNPDDAAQWTELTLALAQQEIEKIIAIKEKTFENTVQALDVISLKFKDIIETFEMLQFVHPDKTMRDALKNSVTLLKDAAIDFSMNPKLYQAIQSYADQNHDHEILDEQDQRLFQDLMNGFKKYGLHLPAETQEKIKNASKELEQMRQNFANNINISNPKITVDKADLAGLDENFIESLKKDGDLYILGTDVPTYIEIIGNCSIEKTRKAIYFLRNNKAYPENDILLTQIVQKQDEIAQLLGYENYATLDLKNTAASTIENVQKFEDNILRPALAKAKKELEIIKADLPEGIICNADGTLNPWDYGYAATLYEKKHFNIDENKIAEYFPTDKVIEGIFTIYQNFLGLTFQKITPLWSWHEDVQLIEIHRTSSGELLGYIFLDLYPRDNKYGHACHAGHSSSYRINGKNSPSVATLICNFPKPCGNTPGLLKHNDVVTFFHEFGHGMHEILGKTKHVGQSGTSVARDFVEVPSQMFEQWMHEPEMLALVSSHYQTGEALPQEIIEQKIKLRKFYSGFGITRQCMIGLFALQLMTKEGLSYNPSALWKSIYEQNWKDLIAYQENNHWYATFGHLINPGYLSKYFCYLWTEVIALDLFSEIKAHGYNQEYQNKAIMLLSAGDSVDAITLTQNFLGREVSQEPFFKILGLK